MRTSLTRVSNTRMPLCEADQYAIVTSTESS